MNRAGFTTVEVIIASALIVTLITGGAIGMRQVSLLGQSASTRTSHTEMRARIFEALLDSGTCAAALGKGTVTPPSLGTPATPPVPPLNLPIAAVYRAPSAVNKIVESGVLVDNEQVYNLALVFPRPLANETFPAGLGRTSFTYRHRALLEIRGERDILRAQGGTQGPAMAAIPISVEFDSATGVLESCTVIGDDMEELLAAPPLGGTRHTVRDCIAIDGTPMPTDIGLVCRVPYHVMNSVNAEPNTNCNFVPGWQNAANPVNFNTTLSSDVTVPICKNGTDTLVTGWHYFSTTKPEPKGRMIKKGGSKLLTWAGGGATFALAAFVGALAGLAGLVIFFILISKCKKEPFTIYAQVNGVGCL